MAQKELFLDRVGVSDSVIEAFAHSLDSEDDLRRKVDENVVYQLTGLENSLHRSGCGDFFCGRRAGARCLIMLARSVSVSNPIQGSCGVESILPRVLRWCSVA